MDNELIIKQVLAFASEKVKIEFEKKIKENPDIDSIYGEFIVNRHVPYMDIIDLIKKFEKQLPTNFKEKFVQLHKDFKDKTQKLETKNYDVVAKIDKFTIINKYKDLAKEGTFEVLKNVIKLIKEVVEDLKKRGFDSIIYGDIYLRNPINPKAIAEYNRTNDDITLKFYKDYSEHATESLIHELMHRIWFELMEEKDHEEWKKEFNNKLNNKEKSSEFPTEYSKTNPIEYHAEVLTSYIIKGKKFSELIDKIF